MSDDLLERAARALREEGEPSAADVAETRARLNASSRNRAASRVRTLRWVLPLAAAFAAGSAFAATNGQIERAVRAVQTWLSEAPEVVEARRPAKKRNAAKPSAAQGEGAAATGSPQAAPQLLPLPAEPGAIPGAASEPVPPEPAPSLAEPAPGLAESAAGDEHHVLPRSSRARSHAEARRAASRAPEAARDSQRAPEPDSPDVTSSSASEASESAPSARAPAPHAPSPDLALYREAHRAHFGARDYAGALALWDTYLARFEHGIFALEARYNRCICLVRLGRKAEAQVALAPFAEGRMAGQYRQREARALLDALIKKP